MYAILCLIFCVAGIWGGIPCFLIALAFGLLDVISDWRKTEKAHHFYLHNPSVEENVMLKNPAGKNSLRDEEGNR